MQRVSHGTRFRSDEAHTRIHAPENDSTLLVGQPLFDARYRSMGGRVVPLRVRPVLRVNTLRITEAVLIPRLEALGMKLRKVPFLQYGYEVLQSRVSPGATTEFLLGYYYLQEAAAQVPVQVLNPIPGERVLDCCASPGGKTTQIAGWMNNTGEVIAYELKDHRIQRLLINLERMGVKNTTVFADDVVTNPPEGTFDKVLVDAPCSGNYVGDEQWFSKRTMDGIMTSVQLQKKILAAVASHVSVNGIMVYSTCSLEPEENEILLDWFTRAFSFELLDTELSIGVPGITQFQNKELSPLLAKTRRFWPEQTGTEGFFVAKLRRIG